MTIFDCTRKHRLLPVLLFFLAQCGPNEKIYEMFGPTMGTSYRVKLIAPAGIDSVTLQAGIEAELALVNGLMSNWLETSDVSRFNAHIGTTSLAIAPETRTVIEQTVQLAEQTLGALDPTLSPLIELWGFGKSERVTFPEEALIAEALARTGYQSLRLSETGLARDKVGIQLNLSATAKGYAVDRIAAFLETAGYKRYLIDVGGEGRAAGENANRDAWHIGIEDPRLNSLDAIFKILKVTGKSFATSGDYRIFFEHEGRHYSHIIHPRTGRPVPARVASATVIAPDCLSADGLATAFLVMAPNEAIDLVNSLPDIECLLLIRQQDGSMTEQRSKGMADYLLEPSSSSASGGS